MEIRSFENVWEALEDTPEAVADMTARSDLMIDLEDRIRTNAWTPTEAAARCGLDRAMPDELLRGNIALFPLDTLLAIAARLRRDERLEAPTPSPSRPAPPPRLRSASSHIAPKP